MTETNTTALKLEIKQLIIDTLKIPDVLPEQVQEDISLFSSDNLLGLDSIDALEIIMALQRKYGVRLDDQNLARFILTSINTITEFVEKERTQ
ncbi:MAG: phosphopantetheine-binding protein [Lentimicrobiaceae bacterium]|nr:phosphopantetheine-binding protein [Lentimicrobiaceae bacterium]